MQNAQNRRGTLSRRAGVDLLLLAGYRESGARTRKQKDAARHDEDNVGSVPYKYRCVRGEEVRIHG